MDYAETITAERVKRVIDGYGKIEGTGGGFSFYELGEPLFIDNEINPKVDINEIRKYIYYSETRQSVTTDDKYLLDIHNDTAYYFYYEPDNQTMLNFDFLLSLKDNATNKIIYANACNLSEKFLSKYSTTLKKISRDIERF